MLHEPDVLQLPDMSIVSDASAQLRDVPHIGPRPLLAYFVAHPNAVKAQLSEAHMVALRWYTTESYTAINKPLRDIDRAGPHPFAATVAFLAQGIGKLRALEAPDDARPGTMPPPMSPPRLWRGMRNVRAPDELMRRGATELAPLSCTTDLEVAAGFASSRSSLLFLVRADGAFMQRGASLQWLSTAPFEQEVLYPPYTYLKPTGRTQVVELAGGQTCRVVECEPHFGAA